MNTLIILLTIILFIMVSHVIIKDISLDAPFMDLFKNKRREAEEDSSFITEVPANSQVYIQVINENTYKMYLKINMKRNN